MPVAASTQLPLLLPWYPEFFTHAHPRCLRWTLPCVGCHFQLPLFFSRYSEFSTPTNPRTPQVFEEPGLPLLLDIGCAKGRWAERMAGASPSTLPGGRHNFLGVELFAPLVAAANARRDAAGGGFCRDSPVSPVSGYYAPSVGMR